MNSSEVFRSRKTVSLIALLILTLGSFVLGFVFKPPGQYGDDKGEDRNLAALLKQATTAEMFAVDHVVDGDTFVVRVNGGKATIRLIGMNTPEVVDPRKQVQCYGPEASARAHALLDGKTVSLSLDPTQDSLDKYGRVLSYAYFPDGTFFNEEMIQEGYAYEYTYKKAYEYQKDFRQAQAAAKKEGLGLFATSTCNGKLTSP